MQINNKTITTASIVVIVLAVVAFLFYWFQYIPHMIARDCSDNLLAKAVQKDDRDFYEKNYKVCVNSGGYENFKTIVNTNIKPDEEVKEEPRPAIIITE